MRPISRRVLYALLVVIILSLCYQTYQTSTVLDDVQQHINELDDLLDQLKRVP